MTTTHHVTPAPAHPPGWLVGQLPVGMRDDDMLVRFATIFERVGTSLREGADSVEYVSDLTVTSSEMLAYLGRWLGYELLDPDLPLLRQREIVAAIGRAMPMRGTLAGLQGVLEAVTDGPVQIDEGGGVLGEDGDFEAEQVVTITVRSTGHLRDRELQALVRDEVPAHVPVRLRVDAGDSGGES